MMTTTAPTITIPEGEVIPHMKSMGTGSAERAVNLNPSWPRMVMPSFLEIGDSKIVKNLFEFHKRKALRGKTRTLRANTTDGPNLSVSIAFRRTIIFPSLDLLEKLVKYIKVLGGSLSFQARLKKRTLL